VCVQATHLARARGRHPAASAGPGRVRVRRACSRGGQRGGRRGAAPRTPKRAEHGAQAADAAGVGGAVRGLVQPRRRRGWRGVQEPGHAPRVAEVVQRGRGGRGGRAPRTLQTTQQSARSRAPVDMSCGSPLGQHARRGRPGGASSAQSKIMRGTASQPGLPCTAWRPGEGLTHFQNQTSGPHLRVARRAQRQRQAQRRRQVLCWPQAPCEPPRTAPTPCAGRLGAGAPIARRGDGAAHQRCQLARQVLRQHRCGRRRHGAWGCARAPRVRSGVLVAGACWRAAGRPREIV